ncbi:unnamed protein product, partial [Brassica rapa subsp. narinosa]
MEIRAFICKSDHSNSLEVFSDDGHLFFLNATSATHFYSDHQCEASAKYLRDK